MLIPLLLIAAGVVFLVKGADYLVDGGSGLALKSGVSPLVVGLTVVAFGTSAPELTASVVAALKGSGDICFGNVVGSNVANIALILGLTALIRPVTVNAIIPRREIPILIVITAMTWYIGRSGSADRLSGFILLLLFAGYLAMCFMSRSAPVEVDTAVMGRSYSSLTVLGIAGLAIGGKLFVDGAQTIARLLGVSEAVIGLTVVAFGTSLPELATSVVAALRGHADISVGNIIGSNIFNILMVLGVTSTFLPFAITPDRYLSAVGLPFMMGLAILMLPVTLTGARVSRSEGALFFTVYIAYIVLAVIMR